VKLDEGRWVLGGGAGAQWRAVRSLRVKQARGELKALGALAKKGPASLKRFGLDKTVSYLSAGPDSLLLFPAMDCWLSVGRSFKSGDRPAAEWELHFPFLQNFAAAKAVLSGATCSFPVRVDPNARVHLTGTHLYFEFPKAMAGKDALVEVSRGAVRAKGGVAKELTPVTESLWLDYRDPLILQPVKVHGVLRPSLENEARFASVLAAAMGLIERFDAPLHKEISDFLRVIVPLENPSSMGSVSSSYRDLRGAFCLSHTDDVLLQAETIVHEFCHQKLNLLFAVDPLLLPGQGGEIVYSPLRPDPRRLGGMLLGAHAFIGVGRFLIRALREMSFSKKDRPPIERNAAKRLFQTELMLRTLSGYGRLTEFGARLTLRMWRELMLQYHDMLDFDPASVAAARKEIGEHAGAFRLGETGFHSGAARNVLSKKAKK